MYPIATIFMSTRDGRKSTVGYGWLASLCFSQVTSFVAEQQVSMLVKNIIFNYLSQASIWLTRHQFTFFCWWLLWKRRAYICTFTLFKSARVNFTWINNINNVIWNNLRVEEISKFEQHVKIVKIIGIIAAVCQTSQVSVI